MFIFCNWWNNTRGYRITCHLKPQKIVTFLSKLLVGIANLSLDWDRDSCHFESNEIDEKSFLWLGSKKFGHKNAIKNKNVTALDFLTAPSTPLKRIRLKTSTTPPSTTHPGFPPIVHQCSEDSQPKCVETFSACPQFRSRPPCLLLSCFPDYKHAFAINFDNKL